MTGEDCKQRMVKLTQRLYRGGPVTTAYIRRTYGVSPATAKRDMRVLAEYLPLSAERRIRAARELRMTA